MKLRKFTKNSLGHKKKCLVLNKNFQPIRIANASDAIGDLLTGAKALNPETYEMLEFHAWSKTYGGVEGSKDSVVSEKLIFKVPDIIVLETDIYKPKSVYSRRKVLTRDRYICQYCGEQLTNKTATVDHVHPRKHGGKNTFDNVVACCRPCNAKKGDKSIEDMNWKLLNKPKCPADDILSQYPEIDYPESWTPFVKK
jgi:hypothetical protein